MIEERRRFPRLVPNAPLFVSLDDAKNGLLLDLCEGGVALASLASKIPEEIVSLEFDLPEGHGHIQAKAEVAWTRDSGHLTGARFVELGDDSRQQLGEWVATKSSVAVAAGVGEEVFAAEPLIVSRASYAQVDPVPQTEKDKGVAHLRSVVIPLQLTREAESKQTEGRGDEGFGRFITSRHPIELFLTVLVLSWSLVFLGYEMGTSGINKQISDSTAAPKLVDSSGPVQVEASSQVPVATLSSAVPNLSVQDPGTVLQVGAMKDENNADAMAKALQEKKFPAFVFKRGTDRLYKVAVGPYSDANATTAIKVELERQGFRTISKRWLPE